MIRDESIDEERGSMLLPRDSSHIELRHFATSTSYTQYDTDETQTMPEPQEHVPETRFNAMVGRAKTLRKKHKARWDRFNGKGRKKIGIIDSLKAIVTSSCESPPLLCRSEFSIIKSRFLDLNVLFAAVPCAWAAHFTHVCAQIVRSI
jgi:hypothetical protein